MIKNMLMDISCIIAQGLSANRTTLWSAELLDFTVSFYAYDNCIYKKSGKADMKDGLMGIR